MPREITNLDINLHPLTNWLNQPTTTILIVIGNGAGAKEAIAQIKRILEESEDDYPNVAFGCTATASRIKADLFSKGIIDFEKYSLISISPDPKKLISKVEDPELIGKPGWIQQAIIEAESA